MILTSEGSCVSVSVFDDAQRHMYSRIWGPCLGNDKSALSVVYGWVAGQIRFHLRCGAVQEDAVEPMVFAQVWFALKTQVSRSLAIHKPRRR
jgi:hypothetical protein